MISDKLREYTFILPCAEHYNPLGMVRSLGEVGIKPIVVVLRSDQKITSASKYIGKTHYVDTIEEGFNLIINNYKSDQKKAFILTSDDTTISFYDQKYDRLKDYFILYNAGVQGRITKFMDKREVCSIASKHGLISPQIYDYKKDKDIEKYKYPVFTKAENSLKFGWKSDAHICNDALELRKVLKSIEGNPVIQQYIHKKNELCLDGFSWNRGKKIFIGIASNYKYVLPDRYSYYLNLFNNKDKELEKKIQAVMEDIQFEGIFSVEFLMDQNDNLYFLEINFRNSTWSYASTKLGMNLVTGWCEAMIHDEFEPESKLIKENTTAMVELSDYGVRVKTGEISRFNWVKDILTTDCTFFFNIRDLRPFWEYILNRRKNKL